MPAGDTVREAVIRGLAGHLADADPMYHAYIGAQLGLDLGEPDGSALTGWGPEDRDAVAAAAATGHPRGEAAVETLDAAGLAVLLAGGDQTPVGPSPRELARADRLLRRHGLEPAPALRP